MEEKVNIKTDDGHIIYGTLNYPAQGTDKLIIFVHGLTGSQKEHQFYDAARYFPAMGYATYRFNQYSRDEKGRVLSDISIRTQSGDLNTVIAHFKGKYSRIYLVGHSIGGPTIMGAGLAPITAIVLWDPSITPGTGAYPFDERLNRYILRWQFEFLLSREMIEEWKNARSLVHDLIKPTRVIFAGGYSIKDTWKDMLPQIPAEHDSLTVEGATHGFDEEGTQEKLYRATLEWLRSH